MLQLPNELRNIIPSISSNADLAALSRCSTDYHEFVSPILYQRDLAGQKLALKTSVSSYSDLDAVVNVFESISKAGSDFSKEIKCPHSLWDLTLPEGLRNNSSQINAVHLAAYTGRTETVKLCIERGYVTSGPFRTGLLRSALYGRHIETSKMLIEHGADLGDTSALEFAAHHGLGGDTETLKFLIERGVDLGDSTALEVAARHGLAEIVRLLLHEKGVDPKGWNGVSSPLFCAVQYCETGSGDDALVRAKDALATVTALLDRGANPNQPGYCYHELKRKKVQMSPLAQACRLKEYEIGLRLLDHGAHPGCTNIPDREAALYRLRRCLLPDESKLIQFTTILVDRLTDTTIPQGHFTESSTEPLDELLSFYTPPREGLFSRPTSLENHFFAPSLECLFVAHALLRAGLRVPWTIRLQLNLMASPPSWTRRNVELRMIYCPFIHVDLIINHNIDRIVQAVETQRKEAHLFGRDDCPVIKTEPDASFQYDLKKTINRWGAFVDIEFAKHVAGIRLRSGKFI